MSNRKFEMFEIRQILIHMRQGESDRALAKAGLVGRRKARQTRLAAGQKGWLDESVPLPGNTILQRPYLLSDNRPNQGVLAPVVILG